MRAGRRRQSDLRWEDAADLWPPRGRSTLPWPLSRMMIAEPARLIYLPNPGSVDAAIQRMMLELSAVPHKSALRQFGIRRVVEEYVQGILPFRDCVRTREPPGGYLPAPFCGAAS